jgi:hypothetical protein
MMPRLRSRASETIFSTIWHVTREDAVPLTRPGPLRTYRRTAQVAELVDALVSGTSAERRGGSSPLLGTSPRNSALFFLHFFRKNPTRLFGGKRFYAVLLWRFGQVHRGSRKFFLIRFARLLFRHSERAPTEHRHELICRRAVVGSDVTPTLRRPCALQWRRPA